MGSHTECACAVRIQRGIVPLFLIRAGRAVCLSPIGIQHHPIGDGIRKDRIGALVMMSTVIVDLHPPLTGENHDRVSASSDEARS